MLISDHGPGPGKSPRLLGGKLRGLCSVLLLPDAVDTARFLSLLKLPSSDGQTRHPSLEKVFSAFLESWRQRERSDTPGTDFIFAAPWWHSLLDAEFGSRSRRARCCKYAFKQKCEDYKNSCFLKGGVKTSNIANFGSSALDEGETNSTEVCLLHVQ